MFRITAFYKGDFKIIIGRHFTAGFIPLCPVFINEILRSWEFTDRYSPTIMGVWRLKEYIDNERSTITMMVWRSCSIIHEIPDLWESHDHSIPTKTRISRSWRFIDDGNPTIMRVQRSCKVRRSLFMFYGILKVHIYVIQSMLLVWNWSEPI